MVYDKTYRVFKKELLEDCEGLKKELAKEVGSSVYLVYSSNDALDMYNFFLDKAMYIFNVKHKCNMM